MNSNETTPLKRFNMSDLTSTSRVIFYGRDINPKYLFKKYRDYFDSVDTTQALLDAMVPNSFLVVIENNLNNRFSSVFRYHIRQ